MDAPDAAAAQLRSLLAGETPPTEHWGTYPDETEPKGPGVKLRYTPGDARMLALVRLANQSFRYFNHRAHDVLFAHSILGE